MRYLGGKTRFAKDIARILLASGRTSYIEPMVGGGSVLTAVAPHMKACLAADISHPLIALYKAILMGWMPPDNIGPDLYRAIRDNRAAYPPELVGFVGFGCSFGGRFFEGFARASKGVTDDTYHRRTIRSLVSAAAAWKNVHFVAADYRLLPPKTGVWYFDPPYAGTKPYSGTPRFDHAKFWRYAAEIGSRNPVYVSSYEAPAPWVSVWSADTAVRLDNTGGGGVRPRMEHVFTLPAYKTV